MWRPPRVQCPPFHTVLENLTKVYTVIQHSTTEPFLRSPLRHYNLVKVRIISSAFLIRYSFIMSIPTPACAIVLFPSWSEWECTAAKLMAKGLTPSERCGGHIAEAKKKINIIQGQGIHLHVVSGNSWKAPVSTQTGWLIRATMVWNGWSVTGLEASCFNRIDLASPQQPVLAPICVRLNIPWLINKNLLKSVDLEDY